MYVYTYVCTNVYMHVCMYIHVCTYACIIVRMYVLIYACVNVLFYMPYARCHFQTDYPKVCRKFNIMCS